MADWLDNFRSGSFRGVPFKTVSSQIRGGRRKQDREFAKRDEGNSEDLGKKLKGFTLELLVLGDDYFEQANALEEALDTQGAGELIHPYKGTIQVQSGEYTRSDNVTEGRMARFSVQFTLAGTIKFPDDVADELNKSIENADAVKEQSKSFFEKLFSVANQPAFVLESATEKLNAVLDFADNAVKQVTEPVTNFTFAIRNFKAAIGDLIKAPGELAQRLQDTFDLLLAEFEDEPETSERIFGNFSELEFEPVIGDTPSRDKEQENQDAILNLTKELALSNQSQAAVEVEFPSTNAAVQTRNAIVEGLDLQLDSADDDLYQSIKDLQTSLTEAVPNTGTSELITIRLNKTTPAIVIAYDNFEDLDKETEIIDQNAIEHPGFVPGGEAILVSAG